MKKQWKQIDVAVSGLDAESLAYEVAEALEVGVEITGSGFRFYAEAAQPGSHWEEKLESVLSGFRSLDPEASSNIRVQTQDLAEEDWADRWKVNFKPLRVGKRFVICPTWEEFNPGSQDRVIRIDPGRAFGTGHHETTRLCLEWLEDWVGAQPAAASDLLDLGTGSGILAMAGALSGFGVICGVDVDGEAVEVARENLAVNGLSERIQLVTGTLDDIDGAFDVVLANIQAGPLISMAHQLAARTRPGGTVALSGILVEQKGAVQAAYQSAGLLFTGCRTDGEWCLLEFRAPDVRY